MDKNSKTPLKIFFYLILNNKRKSTEGKNFSKNSIYLIVERKII